MKLSDLLLETLQEDADRLEKGKLKAILMAGGPGSGKSYVASNLFGVPNSGNFSRHGLRFVNSDIPFEYLLQKHGYDLDLSKLDSDTFVKLTQGPNSIRAKAKRITNQQYENYKKNKTGMIIDGTGDDLNKMRKQKAELEAEGYDVQLVFVNTSLEVAQKRNAQRARKLPEDLVREIWMACQENLKSFKEEFGDDAFIVNNNSDSTLDTKLEKITNHMINRPIKNPIGQQYFHDRKTQATKEKEKAGSPIKQQKGVGGTPVAASQKTQSMMDKQIKNPVTGNMILIKTALGYDKKHPAYQAAVKTLKQYRKIYM